VADLKEAGELTAAGLLRGRWPQIVGLSFTSLAGGLAEAAFLVLITRAGFAVADGESAVELTGGRTTSLGVAVWICVVLVVIRTVFALVTIIQSSRLSSSVIAEMRSLLAESFLNASFGVQQEDRSGQLQELLTTFTSRASSLVSAFVTGLSAGFNLLAMLAFAVFVDPIGSVAIIVAVGVLGLVLRPLRKMVKGESKEANRTGLNFATSLNEISQLGMELHIFNVQPQTEARVRDLVVADADRARRLAVLKGLVPTLYTGLAYLVLVGAVGAIVASDSADLSSLGPVMLLMLRSLSYGQSLQVSLTSISSALPSLDMLQERLDHYRAGAVVDQGEPIDSIGDITLDGVVFEYTEGEPVLRGLDATIHAGEIIGVVGPSGGGKSTLVQLILGLREPTAGRILSDGRDIFTLSRTEWARKVTFVPQAAHLVSGSVADNIRFFREGVSQDDVERATRLASLHDDVDAWPDRYERSVGERGDHLSGGQQQRLCIARALVEQPDVLILDEPTSSLDVRSESLIRATLAELGGRMTIIVIAHRMSTLDICDRLMVIQDGVVKAFDTPANLEQTNDFYLESLVLSGMKPDSTQPVAETP